MHCPRCKHEVVAHDDWFYCSSCFAAFVEQNRATNTKGYVAIGPRPNTYSVKHRAGADYRGCATILLVFAGAAWVLMRDGAKSRTIWILFAGVAIVSLLQFLRSEFGRITFKTSPEALRVSLGFDLRGERTTPGTNIHGFWVRSGMNEGQPTGRFALMIDEVPFDQRALVEGIGDIEPLVYLAETLAANMGLRADTRVAPEESST